jgi:hypothetical protein
MKRSDQALSMKQARYVIEVKSEESMMLTRRRWSMSDDGGRDGYCTGKIKVYNVALTGILQRIQEVDLSGKSTMGWARRT